VIVSAPAPSALPAPVVSLATAPGSKNSAASKTTPFHDFFDSLTQFEDTQNEGAPGQEGAAAAKSPTKKELSPDSGSGSDVAAAALPVGPALPNPSFLLQHVAILPQSADSAAPDSNVSLDQEGPAPQSGSPTASSDDQSDIASLLTPNETAPGSPQPAAQSSASANPAAAASVQYPLLPGRILAGTARLEMATVISSRPAPSAAPAATIAAGPATTATPAKAQVTGSSFEAEPLDAPSSVSTSLSLSTTFGEEPAAAQTPAPSASDPTGSASTIAKPLVPKSVSAPTPLTAAPVPTKTDFEEAMQVPTAQPVTAPQSTSFRIRTPVPVAATPVPTNTTLEEAIQAPTAPSGTAPQSTSFRIRTPVPVAATPVPTNTTLEEAIQAPTAPSGTAPQATSFRIRGSAPLTDTPVPTSTALEEAIQVPTAQPEPEAQATGFQIRTSAPVAEQATDLSTGSVKALVNNSAPIDSSRPVNSSSPVMPIPQVISGDRRTSMQAVSPVAAIPAPLLISDPQPTTPSKPAEQSTVPASTGSPAEKQPDPTLAAPVAPSTSLPAPLPADRDVRDPAPETSSPSVAPHEALAAAPASKIPLLPEAENLAFAIRMLGLESTSGHSSLADSKTTDSKAPVTNGDTPVTQIAATQTKGPAIQPQASNLQQPEPSDNQASTGQQRETQSSAVATEKSDAGTQNQPDLLKAQQTPAAIPHWNEAAVVQAPEIGSLGAASEPVEAARPSLPLATQETHLIAPEPPRTTGSSEILLHLTGNDESSAAIRVADRAGSVNVSVHASDPVLRESLRSNLGELSTQLNAQGWKADVVKSVAVATHSEGQQDSHPGQRGSQQQSSGGERQPQRDRRANGGQWQQELDQQTTGGDALPGGNG
jgi:hypothetical protein